MKNNKIKLAILAMLIAGATTLTSCKKKDTTHEPAPPPDTDVSGANANNITENVSGDILAIASEATDLASNGSLSNYRETASALSCASVIRDTTHKTVTVNFSGTSCMDGKVRSGSLVFDYSSSTNGATHFRHPGFVIVVTSNNYAVNGYTVTVTNNKISNITPIGFNPAVANETWSVTANMSINMGSGSYINWSCNRVKTLLNTNTVYYNYAIPINWANARVGITGSASGSRTIGNETFSVNITNQLVRDFGGCSINNKHPFIQGTFVYSPSGKSDRTFDYGSGGCDLDATVTIDNITYNITLP